MPRVDSKQALISFGLRTILERGAVVDRRQFLTGGAAGLVGVAGGVLVSRGQSDADRDDPGSGIAVPFRGERQAGIANAAPRYATFAAFDIVERDGASMASLMDSWTEVADQLSVGTPISGDTGEATGMGPAGLTVTVGFGETLFDDRCAPASAKPAELVSLPEFPGDQLDPAWNGGDVLVQVCSEDPTVVSHAVRQLRRVGQGRARLRWSQAGFLPQASGETPRNLFGQVDGTANPAEGSAELDDLVWVTDGPSWMVGGTYLATRRIRMMLTMWDRMGLGVQEASTGRDRGTGAPLSGGDEFTPLDLDAVHNGEPVIASDAHVRIAKTAGPGMLRRGYSFDNGPRHVGAASDTDVPDDLDHAEHAQNDHSSMMAAMDDHDAGLFFAAFVRDPVEQFIPMQQALSESDALGHFLAYTSAGLWAVPAGAPTGSIAAELFA